MIWYIFHVTHREICFGILQYFFLYPSVDTTRITSSETRFQYSLLGFFIFNFVFLREFQRFWFTSGEFILVFLEYSLHLPIYSLRSTAIWSKTAFILEPKCLFGIVMLQNFGQFEKKLPAEIVFWHVNFSLSSFVIYHSFSLYCCMYSYFSNLPSDVIRIT